MLFQLLITENSEVFCDFMIYLKQDSILLLENKMKFLFFTLLFSYSVFSAVEIYYCDEIMVADEDAFIVTIEKDKATITGDVPFLHQEAEKLKIKDRKLNLNLLKASFNKL